MNHASPPPQGEVPTDKDLSRIQPSQMTWPHFIEYLATMYTGWHGQPVLRGLPRQELTRLDRHLACGVDINHACVTAHSFIAPPLFLAISQPCPPLVNALIERGASLSMRQIKTGESLVLWVKHSALTWSFAQGNPNNKHDQAISQFLLAAQPPEEINALADGLRTPLAICLLSRHTHARDSLMRHGADAHCRDEKGMTLLHLLAKSLSKSSATAENADWIQWVIDQGVPIDATDASGATARELSRQLRPANDEFVALLDGIAADRQARQLELDTRPPSISASPRLRRI